MAGDAMDRSSRIRNLHLFIGDDGITGIKTRLGNTAGSEETTFPILLPNDHRFTELLTAFTHRRVLHGVVNDTLVELWEYYCIVRGRQYVKKVIYHCPRHACCRLSPASAPMAPLPADRVTYSAIPGDRSGLCWTDICESVFEVSDCIHGPIFLCCDPSCTLGLSLCHVHRYFPVSVSTACCAAGVAASSVFR